MTQKIDYPYLCHIRDAIASIDEWVSGKTVDDFYSDSKLKSAIIRQLEIIGEAARHISAEQKIAAPEIPWRPIMDARNTLIHGYFAVDEKKVWDMVVVDIPILKKQIESLLQTIGQ